ncbi:MAG: exopolyphosphatase / guanosine-5-triphosphate,3-diphosphate pyrophosphatase [Solirubrobacteraceae bacterium]|nr:exopolyphosphatase / guanosine-5-triphosphate,3-diphosphate pyrophosphatase [Solirubrobacteraceae bacterium]
MAERRIAIVDLGSNTFRLVVFTAGDGWWRRTDEIYEGVRIGEGLASTGELGPEPVRRGLAAVEVFAHFCRATGVDEIDAVATSAIREAGNRDEFLGRAALPVRVLTADEEAHYGYLAAVNSTTLGDGCVLDLGGGSLQLTRVVGRLAHEERSWKLGAVRMTERFGDDLKSLRKHVKGKLEDADWLARCGSRLVAIGGTARNLAAADQGRRELPSFGVQGHVIPRKALARLVDELASRSPAERGKLRGIKPERGDIILAGAAVILTVLEEGGFDELEVTEAGLREGVFFSKSLAPDELFDDVRRQSVLNLAGLYHVDHAHTEHVARLALGMFDELAEAGLHPGDAIERELLWAGAVLHDIGMTVDYDDHHKHSRYLVLNGGLPGFTPREVALVGQAVRYHRKGSPGLGPFEPLMRDGDGELLNRISTLLRLAEDLERPRDQIVRAAHTHLEDGRVELRLETGGDAAVSRWAAARETELFASAFGRKLVVPS